MILKKKYLHQIALGFLLTLTWSCSKLEMEIPIETCTSSDIINPAHPKANGLQQKLNQIVSLGVPGIAMAIRDEDGTWASTAGLSKIETNTPMEICHLQFGQSVAKTYMATAILLLYEDGRIDLDERIAAYLPAPLIADISNTEQATVRMLLNHTSGIAEYNDRPEYVTYLLQHTLHTFTVNDYLDYVRGVSSKFAPGERYSYTNTNYLLLALIADQLTGDHKQFIQDEILTANNLNNSYYHNLGFMEHPELVNTYWDRYSNNEIENCSEMHRINVGSLIGDDGIIATPVDFLDFHERLLTNQILEESTMSEMMDFVQKKSSEPDGYGLGIHRDYYEGYEEIGHSGGGIGAGCGLGYFPNSDTYFFIGMNLGTSIEPGVSEPLEKLVDEIYNILIE